MGESDWTFQGFIYLGDFNKGSDSDNVVTDYKNGVYEVEVSDYLNMRETATTSSKTVSQLYNNDQVYVTDIKANGGYTWGYSEIIKGTNKGKKVGWLLTSVSLFRTSLQVMT